MRDATLLLFSCKICIGVSIHASHARRDSIPSLSHLYLQCFNPRVPCETRHFSCRTKPIIFEFQSTRPMRDATYFNVFKHILFSFNPRVPCETRPNIKRQPTMLPVSIHASHARRDSTIFKVLIINFIKFIIRQPI